MHVEGTTRPRTPLRPEFIKSDVYFPSHLIGMHPNMVAAVNNLVQAFIWDIGITTIDSFSERIAHQWGPTTPAASIPPLVPCLFPSPSPLTSDWRVCHGAALLLPNPVPVAIPQPLPPAAVLLLLSPPALTQQVLPPPTPSRRLPTPNSTPTRPKAAVHSKAVSHVATITIESSDSEGGTQPRSTPTRLSSWRGEQMSPNNNNNQVQQATR